MASIKVTGLQAGHFTMPEKNFVSPSSEDAKRTVPSLSFLIEHSDDSGKMTRLLFDLGLRRVFEEYPEGIRHHMGKRRPYDLSRNVITSLREAGLEPDAIDFVILSHVHWDHIGKPKDFPTSTFLIGSGSLDVLAGKIHQVGTHAVFEKDLLPETRTVELRPPASGLPAGPKVSHGGFSTDRPWGSAQVNSCQDSLVSVELEHTLDLFGDGKIRIVDAPGHLQGHINLLIEVGPGPKYLYLAGDACHDRRLLNGEKEIAVWEMDGIPHCIHVDKETAKETMNKIANLEIAGVEVVFAHDWQWEQKQEEIKGQDRWLVG